MFCTCILNTTLRIFSRISWSRICSTDFETISASVSKIRSCSCPFSSSCSSNPSSFSSCSCSFSSSCSSNSSSFSSCNASVALMTSSFSASRCCTHSSSYAASAFLHRRRLTRTFTFSHRSFKFHIWIRDLTAQFTTFVFFLLRSRRAQTIVVFKL